MRHSSHRTLCTSIHVHFKAVATNPNDDIHQDTENPFVDSRSSCLHYLLWTSNRLVLCFWDQRVVNVPHYTTDIYSASNLI